MEIRPIFFLKYAHLRLSSSLTGLKYPVSSMAHQSMDTRKDSHLSRHCQLLHHLKHPDRLSGQLLPYFFGNRNGHTVGRFYGFQGLFRAQDRDNGF